MSRATAILTDLMRIHHIAFRTFDLPRLEAFYVGTLGFVVVRRSRDRSVWLGAGEARVMLEQAEPGEPPSDPRSMELVAFSIAASDACLLEAALGRAGVAIEARTPHTLYFRDPDGRRVGVSSYPFDVEP